MLKGFITALIGISLISGIALASDKAIIKKITTAGPYQEGLVILNTKDYQNVPSVSVTAVCDPVVISFSVQSGLYNQKQNGDSLDSTKGPYQTAVVVLNLKDDFAHASNIHVLGKCSPVGISMAISSK